MKLGIGKNLELGLDAVTQTFAIVAKRGAGKTYLGAVLIEEMLGAGQCVVVLDPVGVLWGLRSSADGKGPGYPILILGGEHADAPLESTAGKVIADWIVDERQPVVLDLSQFRKGEQRRFVEDFAEELYRKNRQPVHLVLDEADMFAPQRPMPGEQRMLGAIEDLVRRGRARGIGLTLITQRPAVLHKDVLTQAECLVALRMLSPQDRDAIDAWIKFHGTDAERKDVLASLPALPIGTAWFWSPGWLGGLQKVQIRKRRTFDSSSTPKAGSGTAAKAAKLAPVDVAALSERIKATVERAKAEDPKALKARVAELERELAQTSRQLETARAARSDSRRVVSGLGKAALASLQNDIARAIDGVVDAAFKRAASTAERLNTETPAGTAAPPKSAGNGAKMSSGERKILTVLAQHLDHRAAKSKIATIAGYAVNGGGFNNYLSALRTRGWLEGVGDLKITHAGLEALGSYEALPTGRALLDHWAARLGKAERGILCALGEADGHRLDKAELGARAGYAPDGGGFNNALSRLRTLELVDGRGEICLREELI